MKRVYFKVMFYREERTTTKILFSSIFQILSISITIVSKLVKIYLKWNKGDTPLNSHVLVKKLSGIRLHTYVDMLGYCVKDRRKNHFEVVYTNVCDDELAVGLEGYVKLGTSFAKNKIVLTSKNLLERCLCYLWYKMSNQLKSTLLGVLLYMLCTSTYIPDVQYEGMDFVCTSCHGEVHG